MDLFSPTSISEPYINLVLFCMRKMILSISNVTFQKYEEKYLSTY